MDVKELNKLLKPTGFKIHTITNSLGIFGSLSEISTKRRYSLNHIVSADIALRLNPILEILKNNQPITKEGKKIMGLTPKGDSLPHFID